MITKKHLSSKAKSYLIILFLAVIFNALVVAWPDFKEYVNNVVWAIVNTILSICAGCIRTLALINGIPSNIEEVQAAENAIENQTDNDNGDPVDKK